MKNLEVNSYYSHILIFFNKNTYVLLIWTTHSGYFFVFFHVFNNTYRYVSGT